MFNLTSKGRVYVRSDKANPRGSLCYNGDDANCISLSVNFRKLQNIKQGESWNAGKLQQKSLGTFQAKNIMEGETMVGKSSWVTKRETKKRNEPDQIKKSRLPFHFQR